MCKITIEKFLQDRENRVYYQNKLLKKYEDNTLVTIRANYPGIEKSNYITDNIVNIISEEIKNYKNITYFETYKNAEGVVSHFLFDNNYVYIKEKMISVEERHILGRCVDIDVYYLKGSDVIGVSRKDFNKDSRKCFLCNEDAKICSRAQTHSIEDIKKYFEDCYSNYINKG